MFFRMIPAFIVFLGCSEINTPTPPIVSRPPISSPTAPNHPPALTNNVPKAADRDSSWLEVGPQGFHFSLSVHFATDQDTSAFRYGWKSERFVVRPGDCFGSDCSRTPVYERKEFGETDEGLAKEGDNVWYGWSFYVPIESHQSWVFFGQIMQPPAIGNSHEPLWMFLKRQGQPFCMIFDFIHTYYYNPWDCIGSNIKLLEDTEFKGQWHDVVLHIKYSSSNENGLTEVWVNGLFKGRYQGYTLLPNRKGAVMKYGIYRTASNQTTIAFYDELRKGKTREEVDIRHLIQK